MVLVVYQRASNTWVREPGFKLCCSVKPFASLFTQCVECSVAECFPEKTKWWLIEQVYQGVEIINYEQYYRLGTTQYHTLGTTRHKNLSIILAYH